MASTTMVSTTMTSTIANKGITNRTVSFETGFAKTLSHKHWAPLYELIPACGLSAFGKVLSAVLILHVQSASQNDSHPHYELSIENQMQ
jgi:hypothetical protein